MSSQYTLGKQERLKSRKAIDQLFSNGKRFTVSPVRVFFTETGEAGLKFGVAVSSRNFKKAVDRNRVKRVLRECWRLQKLPLQQALSAKGKGLHVFFVYTDRELPVYGTIFNTTSVILDKLISKQHG